MLLDRLQVPLARVAGVAGVDEVGGGEQSGEQRSTLRRGGDSPPSSSYYTVSYCQDRLINYFLVELSQTVASELSQVSFLTRQRRQDNCFSPVNSVLRSSRSLVTNGLARIHPSRTRSSVGKWGRHAHTVRSQHWERPLRWHGRRTRSVLPPHSARVRRAESSVL